MLERFIPSLVKDLELGDASLSSGVPGNYVLPLDEGLTINIVEMPGGFLLKSTVGSCPKSQEELFLTQAMLANLFGQGTRGSTLSLSPEGSHLALSQLVDYPVDYKAFREILEDFINVVDFWHDESIKPSF